LKTHIENHSMPAPDLILIPTSMERDHLLSFPSLREALTGKGIEVELCGFGPIAAAASTARLLSSRQVRHILLAGIAGSYDTTLPIGSAWQLGQVGCWGIGIGSGPEFRPASEIGWTQLPANANSDFPGEVLPLFQDPRIPERQNAGLALTCTAASCSSRDCELRQTHFPTAVVEEMECFGVALACLDHQSQLNVPVSLSMLRGISNQAGDRNKAHWQIAPALSAVAQLLLKMLNDVSAPLRSN
jgi:futalosine hydrolase